MPKTVLYENAKMLNMNTPLNRPPSSSMFKAKVVTSAIIKHRNVARYELMGK